MLSKPLLTASLVVLATSLPIINTNDNSPSSIITRVVCIIVGGSAGTYSAVNLHNKGKSVVVIEAQDRLGGHTNTYTDPTTNETIDYGVVLFHNTSVVNRYFAGLNIALTEPVLNTPGQTSTYVDFKTGKVVVGYTPEDPTAALAAYAAQLAQYPYVETGFDLPNPVPADLLLPFGEFVKKHALHDMVGFLFQFGQGLGDILSQLTLYVVKKFGKGILESL
jgi:phytoene dehydrogenase-like protein